MENYLDTLRPTERLDRFLDRGDIAAMPDWLAEMTFWTITDNGIYFER
jgi:hypothetical protein